VISRRSNQKKNTNIENSKYPSHPFSEKGCAIIHPKRGRVRFSTLLLELASTGPLKIG